MDRWMGVPAGSVARVSAWVARGVEVWRGVGLALRGGVGEGVQVGNIVMRGVALERIAVVGTRVGDGLAVTSVPQADKSRARQNNISMLRFMTHLPFFCG